MDKLLSAWRAYRAAYRLYYKGDPVGPVELAARKTVMDAALKSWQDAHRAYWAEQLRVQLVDAEATKDQQIKDIQDLLRPVGW